MHVAFFFMSCCSKESKSLLDGATCAQFMTPEIHGDGSFLCEYLIDHDKLNVMAHTVIRKNADFTFKLAETKAVQTVFI